MKLVNLNRWEPYPHLGIEVLIGQAGIPRQRGDQGITEAKLGCGNGSFLIKVVGPVVDPGNRRLAKYLQKALWRLGVSLVNAAA